MRPVGKKLAGFTGPLHTWPSPRPQGGGVFLAWVCVRGFQQAEIRGKTRAVWS